MRGVSLGMRKVLSYQLILETFYCINEYLSVETLVKVSNGKLFLISSVCMTNSTVFFSGPLGGEISPPKTITNFVCFLDVFHIFSPNKRDFPP